jgi:glycosyltransferase involved in cell wall biosynthesis
MRVEAISASLGLHQKQGIKKTSNSQNLGVTKPSHYTMISFGNSKNMTQVASITPENMGLGLPEAYMGGEGNVGYEMVMSFREHENIDARNFMPFWEHDNPKGGFKFLIHKASDFPYGLKPESKEHSKLPNKLFYSANVGETIEDVAKKLGISVEEISYVIQSKPEQEGPEGLSKYCLLDAPSVRGEIVRPSDKVLGELEHIPYALLKVSASNPVYNKIKGEPHYFYYTPALARAAKPYSYDKWGNSPFEAEIINSDGMRALAKIIHSQMDTPDFGNFNPANVVLHDRIAHPYANYVANMSALGDTSVNGVKFHLIEHNPGRNYQGFTSDPFKMFTMVADESDVKAIRELPYFDILQKAQRYGIENSQYLTAREQQIAWAILNPALKGYQDGAGTYNVLKTGISAAKLNPDNISAGTVSYTFGKEMRSPEMYDAAKFLTDDFAELVGKDVLNGSTPASMQLDERDAYFGRDEHNGFYEARKGFTPFKYNGENIDKIIATREKNGKWFSKLIFEAGEKGQEALNKLFFNEAQIKEGHNVIGYISKMKKGDILDMTWGRAVEQKGYPIALKGMLKFLQDPTVSKKDKLRYKLIIGGGPWNKADADYVELLSDLKKIQELDGGIYKHNAMIVDGWFSKRFVGCATYGTFTSRREICGITPLEAKAAGVPYSATNTGGPADYTNSMNGYLTKHPVEENPEKFGLTWNNSPEEIDKARVERASDEMVDTIKAKIHDYVYDKDEYVAKCKKNIEEKTDWHENSEFNRGKSANKHYLEDIFEVDKPFDSRNKSPLKRVFGAFGKFEETAEELLGEAPKSRPIRFVFAIIGGVAVVTGLALLYKNKKKKSLDKVA